MSQYFRKCNLIFANEAGEGLDVSELRISFAIEKTDGQTPNTANIRVYGLNQDTRTKIQREYTSVLMQAGYLSNFGVVFAGTAKQVIFGLDNATDSYLEIQAADGDGAYNFATVNATISAGASQRDQINQAMKSMEKKGVAPGSIEVDDSQKLPRGKTMYGMSRDYMRQSSQSGGSSWTIQDGKVKVIPLTGVLPGQAVVLNSGTGLVGRPEQTNTGIKFRCLLNPFILIGGAIQIAQADIQAMELDLAPKKEKEKEKKEKEKDDKPATIEADGFYRVIKLVYTGDTRGNDWYCEGEGLDIDTTVKDKKVQGN